MSKQAMLAAIESLQPDPADPKGLVAPSGLMDVMTSQTVSVAGDRWSVQYGTGHSRWDFAVEHHWAATGPPLQYTDPRNSRLLQVGDLQVLITKDDVVRDGNGGSAEANVDIARWNDGHGHLFSLAGDFTDQQLRDAVQHTIKVAPDDPRVTALVN